MIEKISTGTEGIEFDLYRHPEKKGEAVMTQTSEGEEGEKYVLPFEGIIQAQKNGAELAQRIEDAPDRAVYWGFDSNQARTQEADYIFSEEINYITRKHPDWKIVDLADTSLEEIAQSISQSEQKIVIVNSGQHEAMGMHAYNMEEVEKDLVERGMSEVDALKSWLDNPETQARYGKTPEEVLEVFKQFLKEQIETARKLFPGRPVIISGIGHSWELDIEIAASLGKQLTGESIDEMGGMINTMEGARIEISPDGKVTTKYRNLESEIQLDQ